MIRTFFVKSSKTNDSNSIVVVVSTGSPNVKINTIPKDEKEKRLWLLAIKDEPDSYTEQLFQ